MGSFVWAGLIAAGLAAAWLLLRGPLRTAAEERDAARAREGFRLRRERLEARFLAALAAADPIEALRWEDARWRDEVVWARDRQTRRPLALVGVDFEPDFFPVDPDIPPRQATALFEFRKGDWHAEGIHFDEIRPDEAFLRHRRFEPVVLPQRRG